MNRDWRSRWYADEAKYASQLHEDLKIRKYVKKRLEFAAVARITIERAWDSIRVTIHSARPGLVIGRRGMEIEKITADIAELSGGKQVKIDIVEIKQPELSAQLVAENVATQLERRIAFRRAMKRAIQTTSDFGAMGIKLRIAGRLGGADIARAERAMKGSVPLQSLRVPIDFGFAEAQTTYGIIGVKCWLYRKEDAGELAALR